MIDFEDPEIRTLFDAMNCFANSNADLLIINGLGDLFLTTDEPLSSEIEILIKTCRSGDETEWFLDGCCSILKLVFEKAGIKAEDPLNYFIHEIRPAKEYDEYWGSFMARMNC